MSGLRDLQKQVRVWSARNFGNQPSWRPLLGVMEELGELCHAHLKREQGIRTSEDHRAKQIDAVADVIIYLCDYCALEGIDMETAVLSTWETVSKRDWKADPSGKSVL